MTLLETSLKGIPRHQGKVRDVYDLGDRLLLVATDRISAFDWVLPTGIPDKGRVLTGLSAFWFGFLDVPNHLISTAIEDFGIELEPDVRESLSGRSMLVCKARVVPFECVVRGYLAGSGWKEYRATRSVCGVRLPEGLVESDRIEPIFTPATKAVSGHDENVSFDVMASAVGTDVADTLRSLSLEVYRAAAAHARERGLILADTKFEWGFDDQTGELLLVDEVLTPDSSRYWARCLSSRRSPGIVRQAIREGLAGDDWMGQVQPAAQASR